MPVITDAWPSMGGGVRPGNEFRADGCGACVMGCKFDALHLEPVSEEEWFHIASSFTEWEEKRLAYDLDRVSARVAEIYGIEVDDIFLKGKQQIRVKARSLFCFWAVSELEISLTELARRLGISVAGVGYSVERGEIIVRENDYQLIK